MVTVPVLPIAKKIEKFNTKAQRALEQKIQKLNWICEISIMFLQKMPWKKQKLKATRKIQLNRVNSWHRQLKSHVRFNLVRVLSLFFSLFCSYQPLKMLPHWKVVIMKWGISKQNHYKNIYAFSSACT